MDSRRTVQAGGHAARTYHFVFVGLFVHQIGENEPAGRGVSHSDRQLASACVKYNNRPGRRDRRNVYDDTLSGHWAELGIHQVVGWQPKSSLLAGEKTIATAAGIVCRKRESPVSGRDSF